MSWFELWICGVVTTATVLAWTRTWGNPQVKASDMYVISLTSVIWPVMLWTTAIHITATIIEWVMHYGE